MHRILYTAAILALTVSSALADVSKINCSFRYDGFRGGKSNVVSCSMSPDEVFSTNNRPQSAMEMCDQKTNAFQENIEDYVVDMETRTVSYTSVLKISDFAKSEWIRSGLAKGETVEEATADANEVTKRKWSYKIESVDVGTRKVYFKMTGGMYNPPKEIPNYIIRYGESTLQYSIGVPEAVISETTGNERHTWVAMTFGLCQSE